jgi:DUF1016 N-terminal domain
VPPKRLPRQKPSSPIEGYDSIVLELVDLVESARRVSARSVNAVMTETYWEIGRRMVEFEQRGKKRAEYGEALLERLAADLTVRFGRANLAQMRKFFLTWPQSNIVQTVSGQFEESQSGSPLFPVVQTLSWRISRGPTSYGPALVHQTLSVTVVSLRASNDGFKRRSSQILRGRGGPLRLVGPPT